MTDEPKTNLELAESIGIVKQGYRVSLTHEYLASCPVYFIDPFAPPRKYKSKKFIPADKAERKAFKKWHEAYLDIEAEGIKRGWASNGYEGLEINEPNGHWEYEWEEDE